MAPPSVTHRPEPDGLAGVFELDIGGRRAGFLWYSLDGDDTLVIAYVEVDPSLRGQKMGERLVAAAVEWARANKRQIIPLCSYARAVLRRTSAYRDVLKK